MDVQLEAPDNNIFSEDRKEFSINITNVEAINTTGALMKTRGAPLQIIVYNNDSKTVNLTCNFPLHNYRMVSLYS